VTATWLLRDRRFAVSSIAMRYLALLICVAACGTDDADVAGVYSLVVTNGDNGCNFMNWNAGDSTTADVTLTQDQNNVTASVAGIPALVLEAVVGGHVFTGKVSGDALDLNLFGTRSNTTGNCTYTYNAELRAASSGDVLSGQITYAAATNGNPDCAGITNCRSIQDVSGARPAAR
jgi:hypothetical protein